MNEEKLKVRSKEGLFCHRELSCLLMESTEGQRIKEVSTPQVIV